MNVEMNITTIREYQPTDKNAVIDLIRQNTPAYFAPKEEADFSNYLDSERELYFVLLLNKKVVGCGGINFTKDKASGKISWDIIHPQYQGKSLGAQLLKYRIEILTVRTSQLAYKFYEKQGFTLKEIQRDYWAKGFDMYSMEYNGH